MQATKALGLICCFLGYMMTFWLCLMAIKDWAVFKGQFFFMEGLSPEQEISIAAPIFWAAY